MIKNFLFLFGVSLLGLALAYRTAHTSDLNRITGIQSIERALSILGMMSVVILFVFFPSHFFFALIIPPICLIISSIGKKIILHRRTLQFHGGFERFLDIVILEMRTGCSFRLAIEKSYLQSRCPFFRERIQMLLQSMAFASPDQAARLPKNVAKLFRWMIEIDAIGHRQIPRLQTFRQQLRLESEFRHKSGQATRQARAQAWILIGLYLALLLFVIGHFPLASVSRIIAVSAALLLTGRLLHALDRTKTEMESLAPPLQLVEYVISSIENGDSVRSGIKLYLQNTTEEGFCQTVALWLFSVEQGLDRLDLVSTVESPHRRAVLSLLEMGMKGQTIHDRLIEIKSDIVIACNAEIETFISLLPLKLLLPLLIFMFPAFLILLLGPMLNSLLHLL